MIKIASFSPEHMADVISVILPIQQSEFEIPITLDAQPDLKNITEYYQHAGDNFWVALDDGKVVGTMRCSISTCTTGRI